MSCLVHPKVNKLTGTPRGHGIQWSDAFNLLIIYVKIVNPFTTKIITIGRVSTVPVTVDTRSIRHVSYETRVQLDTCRMRHVSNCAVVTI
jgi:hypothetical protein